MKNIIKKISKINETIRIKFRRKYIFITRNLRRKKINEENFTIISNNCWGGFIYQSYNLKYKTPTLGMFFISSDYLKFISNLEYYLKIDEFKEVKPNESKWYNQLKHKDNFGKYPIARLGDIELHLLHYKTIDEANKKWNERKKRINNSKIIYKFSEMNLCTSKEIELFQSMNLENKICFISKRNKKYKNDYTKVVTWSKKDVKSSEEPFGNSIKININKYINNLTNEKR